MPQKQPPARIAFSVELPILLLTFLWSEPPTALAITFAFEFIEWDNPKRCRVDAIAQPAHRARTIIKNMAKMAIAMCGSDLRPLHSMSGVLVFHHILWVDGFGEAGPSRVTLELVR